MTIETKFEIGDDVWCIDNINQYPQNNEITTGKIVSILVVNDSPSMFRFPKDNYQEIKYKIDTENGLREKYILQSNLFKTKEELIQSL